MKRVGRKVSSRRLGLAMGLSLVMLAASLQAAPASAVGSGAGQTTATAQRPGSDQGGGIAATQAASLGKPILIPSGRAFSFRVLRRIGWDDPFELPIDPYAVKAAIQRLRAKLEVAGAPIAIEAVPGYGFRAEAVTGARVTRDMRPGRAASGPGHGVGRR